MARTHVEHIHAPQIDAVTISWPGWSDQGQVKILSEDDETGAQTSLMSLPAGYTRPQGSVHSDQELFVVSGKMSIGDTSFGRLTYRYVEPELTEEPWTVLQDTELLFMTRTGKPDLTERSEATDGAGVIHLDGDGLPWEPAPFPGGPPGVEVALLRMDQNTSETSMVARGKGPRSHSYWEYHDCTEEAFMIDGDITIAPGGLMTAGTYFWRPPYLTHGMSSSQTTSLLFGHTGGQLINHFTDRGDRTPEENRAQSEREALRQLKAARLHSF